MARGLLLCLSMSQIFNVGSLQRALDYHAERHNVVASNIANANTPGFRPLELLRVDAPGAQGSLPLTRTEGAHLVPAEDPGSYGMKVSPDESSVGGLDGNSVSIEREMSKLQANDLRYQGAAKLVTRQLAMLRYAASDASGG